MNKEEKWLLEEKYNGVANEDFYGDLKRLAVGEPLPYIIGSIPFLNCKIYLDSTPLIPRPETEWWVEKLLVRAKVSDSPYILDLCAGSGCIGVAVAANIPVSGVDFSEINAAHLPTIKKNLTSNHINSPTKIIQSDLFSSIIEKYDFILSNPPYIDKNLNRVEESVKNFEPEEALYGGKNGLEIIEKIIKQLPNFLKAEGEFWLEHEPEQSVPIQKLAEDNNFNCQTYKDQYQVERFSVLKYKHAN